MGSVNPDHSECIGRLLSSCSRLGIAAYFSGGADHVHGIVERRHLGHGQLRTLLEVLSPGRFGVAELAGSLGGLSHAIGFATAALNTLPPGRPGVIHLEDSWALAMMHRDNELADAFSRHVLAGVLAAPASERARLLHTLRTYIALGGSVNGVARTEFLHRNTVRKRLARIEALTGRELADPRAVTELTLAVGWLGADGDTNDGCAAG